MENMPSIDIVVHISINNEYIQPSNKPTMDKANLFGFSLFLKISPDKKPNNPNTNI